MDTERQNDNAHCFLLPSGYQIRERMNVKGVSLSLEVEFGSKYFDRYYFALYRTKKTIKLNLRIKNVTGTLEKMLLQRGESGGAL